jgi:hypothetical protein
MKYNIERRAVQYQKAKKRIEKMYKGCKLSARERGGFFIENAEGRNIIALKYPDLAFAKDVMSAYINLDIVSHWNKIEDRNSRKFRNDLKNVVVVGDGTSY